MTDIDKSKPGTNNFIVYSTNCDLTEVNSVIKHLEITMDNLESQLDDITQCSESSLYLDDSETLHRSRKQGGTVIYITDKSTEAKTCSLRSVIKEKSLKLKDKGICFNVIVNQVCGWISLASELNDYLDISTYNNLKQFESNISKFLLHVFYRLNFPMNGVKSHPA